MLSRLLRKSSSAGRAEGTLLDLPTAVDSGTLFWASGVGLLDGAGRAEGGAPGRTRRIRRTCLTADVLFLAAGLRPTRLMGAFLTGAPFRGARCAGVGAGFLLILRFAPPAAVPGTVRFLTGSFRTTFSSAFPGNRSRHIFPKSPIISTFKIARPDT